MRAGEIPAIRVSLLLVCLVGSFTSAWPKDRLVRRIDHTAGLPVAGVYVTAQDTHGFLWIGTNGGLVRYDGRELRPWGQDVFNGAVSLVAVGPAGRVVVGEQDRGVLFEVIDTGLRPYPDRDGHEVTGVRSLAFTSDGRLWLIHETSLSTVQDEGWSTVDPGDLADERPRRLVSVNGSGMLVITDGGVWRIDGGGPAQRILALRAVVDVLVHPNGSLFVLHSEFPAKLVEYRGGERIEHASLDERPLDLELRGEAVWASFKRNLVVLRPGESVERLGVHDDFERTGGLLLVDREESLWMSNFLGLFQFPEPDTVVWTQDDGIPIEHTRFLARTEEGTWVSTWGGMALLDGKERWRPEADGPRMFVRGKPCTDANDRLWAEARLNEGTLPAVYGFVRRDPGGSFVPVREFWGEALYGRCASATNGTVWLFRDDELWRTTREGDVIDVATIEGLGGPARASWETEAGVLWVAGSGRVCHAPSGLRPRFAWTCENLEGTQEIQALIDTPSGAMWAATTSGLYRRDGEGWEVVPGSRSLPSSWMFGLEPSPSGGIWLVGQGTVLRIAERTDLVAGWEILEHPGLWQGLPVPGAQDVLEQADGTLWLTTSAGVIEVPPQARRSHPDPPPVRLVDVTVDGRPLVIARGSSQRLPFDRNRVELSFAALTYRDPSRIRYKVRPRPEAPWSESKLSAFRFIDLPPGDYRPEITASLDGTRWSEEQAAFSFTVLAPWYRRPWAVALFGLTLVAALYVAYRVRLALALRLERQRARIAMDLHDEMGSGLGSIGILADLASEPDVDERARRSMVHKIASASAELSGALGDIVWSLRSGSDSLEALASQVSARGGQMFPDRVPRFVTVFPERWPQAKIALPLRRNLQRIAVEALHNAAKHSGAERVELGFAAGGGRWRMWIEDDGRGIDTTREDRDGLGLDSMRTRADEIGAEIDWSRPPNGGTRVEVSFDPAVTGSRRRRRPA